MPLARLAILLVFGIILGVPFIFRPPEATPPRDAATLVVITPHNEQIRLEFATAFDAWHRANYNQPAVIDWRQPGGTSEIRKQLNALYKKAIATGQLKPDGTLEYGSMPFDLCFGGGSYEHDQLRIGVSDTPPGGKEPVNLSISTPAGFTDAEIKEWFGDNIIGAGYLYEPGDPAKNVPGQNWIGSALSGFGIVYNRDALHRLGLPEPANWPDLCDPRYSGWLALADPRASGSVETSFNSILDNFGWDEGWRILRDMCANARSFANSSPKIPLDVSAGEAAAGLSIDYYGRYQSQAVMRPGETPETSRVGYIDPIGTTFIDADPITILRGGPNPELARRFVRFVLSDQGQALWQFPTRSASDTLGPVNYELRRMPVRRDFIEANIERFVDKVDPFKLASTTPSRNWRSAVKPMMGAFAIDIHHDIRAAWDAMHEAKKRGASSESMEKMKVLFYAWPDTVIDELTLHPDFASLSPQAQALVKAMKRRSYSSVTDNIAAQSNHAEKLSGDREQTLLFLAALTNQEIVDSRIQRLADDRPTSTDLNSIARLAQNEPQALSFNSDHYRTIRAYWRFAEEDARMNDIRIAYTEFFRKNYREIVRIARASGNQ